jgi:MYXO-CTERM domain-containing protein
MGTIGSGWGHGDLNYDGVVNADDWSLFQYGNAIQDGSIGANVPEPAALSMIAMGAIPLLRRRRV